MTAQLFSKLADLYHRMHTAYGESASEAGLSCTDCTTNCCTSYFQHHTYIEWLYVWKGMRTLPPEKRLLHLLRRVVPVIIQPDFAKRGDMRRGR